jgi:hypothetical protein
LTTLRPLRRAAAVAVAAVLASCGSGGGGGGDGLLPLTPGSIDLFIDAEAAEQSMQLVVRTFAPDHCAVVEGATVAGTRRLLRFDTVIANLGEMPLFVGDPEDPVAPLEPEDFEYSPCHDHHHFSGFVEYELRDADDDLAGLGHKQAFCLLDSLMYRPAPSLDFDCHFQGISPGWADLYDRSLDGQWVDVTDVAPGDYTLVIIVNANGAFDEGLDLYENVARIPVTIPPP